MTEGGERLDIPDLDMVSYVLEHAAEGVRVARERDALSRQSDRRVRRA